MKEKTILLIIGIIAISLLILIKIELMERNKLLAEDPCKYYREHCKHVEFKNEKFKANISVSNLDFLDQGGTT